MSAKLVQVLGGPVEPKKHSVKFNETKAPDGEPEDTGAPVSNVYIRRAALDQHPEFAGVERIKVTIEPA